MSWRRYLNSIVWRTVLLASILWAAVILIDPFDIFAFSLPLDRGAIVPVDQRHHPGLAAKHAFDSAIVGSSLAYELNPKRFSDELGGAFINLAILAPEPWEVGAMLDLFLRRRPAPRYVMFELTHYHWCRRLKSGDGWQEGRAPLQEWFFDDNPWNDLRFHFSLDTLKNAGKQLRYLVTGRGLFSLDELHWYRPALPIDEVRANFDRDRRARAQLLPIGGPDEPIGNPSRMAFGDHTVFEAMVTRLPAAVHRIVVFPPLHVDRQPAPRSADAVRTAECKRRITRLAKAAGRATVIDLLFPSSLTRDMRNYVDPLHPNAPAADRIADLIATTVRTGRPADASVRVLAR